MNIYVNHKLPIFIRFCSFKSISFFKIKFKLHCTYIPRPINSTPLPTRMIKSAVSMFFGRIWNKSKLIYVEEIFIHISAENNWNYQLKPSRKTLYLWDARHTLVHFNNVPSPFARAPKTILKLSFGPAIIIRVSFNLALACTSAAPARGSFSDSVWLVNMVIWMCIRSSC